MSKPHDSHDTEIWTLEQIKLWGISKQPERNVGDDKRIIQALILQLLRIMQRISGPEGKPGAA